MKQQEYLNLKRKIENNFTKVQANVLLDILNRIKRIEDIEKMDREMISLMKKNSDLKMSILAYRLKKAGVDFDISGFEIPEENTTEGE